MTANAVLSYRVRNNPQENDPSEWGADIEDWADNERLANVRERAINKCKNIDLNQATRHFPELWLCDENGNGTGTARKAPLTWTVSKAREKAPELFEFHNEDEETPKAFILFTFPLVGAGQKRGVADMEGGPALKQARTEPDDAQRHELQARDRMTRAASYEGWNNACYFPAQRLTGLYDLVLQHQSHCILIRSPPGSGKTALAEAFCAYYEKTHPVYFIDGTDYASDVHKTLNGYITTLWDNAGVTAPALLARGKLMPVNAPPILVVIDEAWKFYDDQDFLSFAKSVGKGAKILLFLFSSVGMPGQSPTPPSLGALSRSFDFMQVDVQTAEEIGKLLLDKKAMQAGLKFYRSTLDAVVSLCNGHVRLIRAILENMCKTFRDYIKEEQQAQYIISNALVTELNSERPFLNGRNFIYEVRSGTKFQVFMDIFFRAAEHPKLQVDVDDGDLLRALVTSGLFFHPADPTNPTVQLVCPLVFEVILSRITTGSMELDGSRANFWTFLEECVRRIEGQRLMDGIADVNTAGHGVLLSKTSVDEFLYQALFYRALATVIRLGAARLQCNVGKKLENNVIVNKQCDFFVDDDKRLAVELLRNDDRLQEHLDRFYPPYQRQYKAYSRNGVRYPARVETVGGDYMHLHAKQVAVINFVTKDKTTLHSFVPKGDAVVGRQPILWTVVYSGDYKEAKVFRPDGTTFAFKSLRPHRH